MSVSSNPVIRRNSSSARGSRLELTPAGETLLTCAERLAGDYRRMEYEMSLCASAVEGELRLGASTTIAQYLLPPILARFTTRFPGVRVAMMSGNSDQVEQALGGHGIDLGMVESLSRVRGCTIRFSLPTSWCWWPARAVPIRGPSR